MAINGAHEVEEDEFQMISEVDELEGGAQRIKAKLQLAKKKIGNVTY